MLHFVKFILAIHRKEVHFLDPVTGSAALKPVAKGHQFISSANFVFSEFAENSTNLK